MDNDNSSVSGINCGADQEQPRSSRVSQALIITAAMIIILAGIQFSSALVGPMLLALFIAIILLVPLRWLQTHGCPNFLSYPIVLGCTIALFAGVTYFVGQTLNDEIRKIPTYRDQFVEKYAALEAQFEQYIGRLGFVINKADTEKADTEKMNIEDPPGNGEASEVPETTVAVPIPPEPHLLEPHLPEPHLPEPPPILLPEQDVTGEEGADVEGTGEEGKGNGEEDTGEEGTGEEGTGEEDTGEEDIAEESGENTEEDTLAEAFFSIPEVRDWVAEMERKDPLPTALEPSVVAFWIARAMLYLQGILGGAFLVLLFTIFMLFEAVHFPKKVNRAFGTDGPINIGHLHHIAVEIRRYLFLKTLSNLMSASAALLVYWMFGVPGALFWGIIAFFMYYIPNLGGTLAAVIPGILIFMMADISTVLLYAVCLLTVECAIAYGIEPKLLGHGLRLSTLVIILSLFFWGFLLGPIGLFLAAPLTVMMKIVLQAFPETRWCAVFLDGGRE